MVDPVLKWAGGKRQLLDELYARFPSEYNDYHEPMFGGGALFFDLEPENGTINDTNPRLINFYEQIRDNPNELIDRLQNFSDPESEPDPAQAFADTRRNGKETENYYYQQRELFNRRPHGEDYDELEEAALLLYLNRTCYNGLYRENSDGGFNVPIGRYKNPDWIREKEIRAASEILAGVELYNTDFEYVHSVADGGDLVYFDPPYEPMSSTAEFTEYSAEGFDRADQKRLLDIADTLDRQKVSVILSNSGVLKDMYETAGFYVKTETARRAINSDGDNRGEVNEIIATNIPPEDQRGTRQTGLNDF